MFVFCVFNIIVNLIVIIFHTNDCKGKTYKFKTESKIHRKKVKINVNIKTIEAYSRNKYMYILYISTKR